MRTGRTLRSIAVLASVALLLGAFVAGPAQAKKKKKKKPPVAVCATYTPTSWGAEQPITVVTDANTADAPLTLEVATAAGVGSSSAASPDDGDGATSHAFANVQIDSAAPTTGLYATLHYAPVWDYDLFVRGDDGVGLAYSAGFAEGVPFLDGTGNGGRTGTGTENIEGLTTNDCQGYLVDIAGATTPGQTVTLDLWLGEAIFTPGG
jgi:hypothetical protein